MNHNCAITWQRITSQLTVHSVHVRGQDFPAGVRRAVMYSTLTPENQTEEHMM